MGLWSRGYKRCTGKKGLVAVFCHLFGQLCYVEGMRKGQQRGTREWERKVLGELLKIIEYDSQCFASFEIVEEGVVGLGSFGRVFLSKVDKVGAVGKDMAIF